MAQAPSREPVLFLLVWKEYSVDRYPRWMPVKREDPEQMSMKLVERYPWNKPLQTACYRK